MSDYSLGDRTLLVPRGTLGLDPLRLEMSGIYNAEGRLRDVALVTPATAPELQATFNVAANEVGKYLAWVRYEKLRAEKSLGIEKARVTIDEMPAQAVKMKEAGMKMNEDLRDALFARDTKCSDITERINAMEAVIALLEGKFWSFIRAFNSAGGNAATKDAAPVSRFNAAPGQLETVVTGFMGKPIY